MPAAYCRSRVRSRITLRHAGTSPTVLVVDKRGVVRVCAEFSVRVQWFRYSASWQPDPEASSGTFYSEDGPGWNDVEGAVAWGRRRAPVVYVRLGDGWRDWYNAGELDDRQRPPTKRWPGSARRRAANREPDYGGVVYIGEEFPDYVSTGRFNAVWSDDAEVLEHERDLDDVDAAIDWGRARAPVVLVAEAPNSWSSFPTYEVRSAGEQDPIGERVPRIRARTDGGALIWELRTKVAARSTNAAEYARRLEDTLAATPAVISARCGPAERSPRAWTSAQLSAKTDALAPAPTSDLRAVPDDWVDVVVRTSAAARSQAHHAAFHAVATAHYSLTGETFLVASTSIAAVEVGA